MIAILSSFIFVTSRTFLGVPSGLVISKTSSPLNPTISQILTAKSFIDTSTPVPKLIGECSEYSFNKKMHPLLNHLQIEIL